MSERYMLELLRVTVAQICQTIGYHATQHAPLELLQDTLHKFLQEFARDLRRQVEHYNRTEVNLDDTQLSLNSLNINVGELLDYINNVEAVPFGVEVPKFPASKQNNLNFLKPGSKEVLTRPVHIYEHLPPMLPPEPSAAPPTPTPPSYLPNGNNESSSQQGVEVDCKPKFPAKIEPAAAGVMPHTPPPLSGKQLSESKENLAVALLKNATAVGPLDEEGRPTREISSVVMTTGGFISPAIEGKLPDALIPPLVAQLQGYDAPPPPPPPPPPPAPAQPAVPASGTAPEIATKPEDKPANADLKGGAKQMPSAPSESVPGSGAGAASFEKSDEPLFDALAMPLAGPLCGKKLGGQPSPTFASKLLKKAKKKSKYLMRTEGLVDPLHKTQTKRLKMLQKLPKTGGAGKRPSGSAIESPTKDAKKWEKHSPSAATQQKLPPFPPLALQDALPLSQFGLQSNLGALPPATPGKLQLLDPPPVVEFADEPEPGAHKLAADAKLSNEPDRTKLNIFKKISKQKAAKPLSPNRLIYGGALDSPIINLPSGTTITATPTAGASVSLNPGGLAVDSKLQQPHSTDELTGATSNLSCSNLMLQSLVNPTNAASAAMPAVGAELADEDGGPLNKPKKRGRKPGSKNQPKSPLHAKIPPLPGVLGTTALPKKSKKLKGQAKMQQSAEMMKLWPSMYGPQLYGLPRDDSAALPLPFRLKKERKKLKVKHATSSAAGLLPLESGGELADFGEMPQSLRFVGKLPSMPAAAAVPTKEEVSSINKKLMRMDTIIIPSKHQKPHNLLLPGDEEATPEGPAHSPSKSFNAKKRVHLKQLQAHLLQVEQMDMHQKQTVDNTKMPGELPPMPNEAMKMFMSRAMAGIPNPPLFSYYPLAPRPGLIPSAHPFLPVMPFPMMKTPPGSKLNASASDLDHSSKHDKLAEMVPLPGERGYCNIAPLVPESMKLTPPEAGKQKRNGSGGGGGDYPRTPKVRQSPTVSEISHDLLLKNLETISTPESSAASNNRSLPMTPGGVSLESLSQLNALTGKAVTGPSSRLNAATPAHDKAPGLFGHGGPLSGLKHAALQPPLACPTALNPDDPIEVSDDSVDAPPEPLTPSSKSKLQGSLLKPPLPGASFMSDIFTPNSGASNHPGLKLSSGSELEVSPKDAKKAKKTSKASKSAKHGFGGASATSSFGLSGLDVLGAAKGGVGKLAGGADLIPLASTGLAYSAKTIPANCLTGPLAPQLNLLKKDASGGAPAMGDFRVDMGHGRGSAERQVKKQKKLKKLKVEKIKRKKDKKDKMRGKELKEKYLLKSGRAGLPPELFMAGTGAGGPAVGGDMQKEMMKKIRKELKKKHKQQQSLMMQNPHSSMKLLNAPSFELPMSGAFGSFNTSSQASGSGSSTLVPKLTLKLGASQSPTPPDEQPTTAPTTSRLPASSSSSNAGASGGPQSAIPVAVVEPHSSSGSKKRELSPELARISPLVTRPPKQKQSADGGSSATATTTTAAATVVTNLSVSGANSTTLPSGSSSATATSAANADQASESGASATSASIVPPPSPWLAGGTLAASAVLLPQQLLQSAKAQEQLSAAKNEAPSGAAPSGSSSSAVSGGGAQRSGVDEQQTAVSLIAETSKPSSYIDAEGNRVWICPACGKVDDGSPMIGCDGCDAWYHWVCVGISVAPKDNEDWFCRVCITRKRGAHGADKKRKRSKKR